MDRCTGILGLGSRSTLFYIEQLNKGYNKKHGGYSTFPFKMLNVDFQLYNPFLPAQYDILLPQLQKDLNRLNDLGVEKILIPNITLHQTVDRLPDDFLPKQKIIHPYKLAIKKMKEKGLQEAVLLGTVYTMQSQEIKKLFEKNNIQISAPVQEDQIFIDRLRKDIYYKPLEKEKINHFKEVLAKYQKPKSAFILACSELSLASAALKKNLIVDLVALQIEKTLNL